MYQNGVMPTDEWFEKIKAHVDFKDKSVIDYGCAEGIMCKLAKEAGARQVVGIDNQDHYLNTEGVVFLRGNIELFSPKYFDVKIFSMIIHWIDKEEMLRLIQKTDKAVIIFREKNRGYQVPINGKWFPTLKELTGTLRGFKLKHTEILMEQDSNKTIRLAIYEKDIPRAG